MWLVAAASPVFPNAPDSMKAELDTDGYPLTDSTGALKDGPLTPDGYVVNTAYSVNTPHPMTAVPETLVPNQTMPTIGDRLTAANVDWAWYAGGWSAALAGTADPKAGYQYHHQPFEYFANYADGTPAKAAHLKDEQDFIAAANTGSLPAVSFVKPVGIDDEHPNRTDVLTGEAHVLGLINAVRNGPHWKDVVIIVTYDENGGFWDHVAPPKVDRWGPGARVPTVIISPFARAGFVDHTVYDTTSILAFIEHRWGLLPLGARDGAAADLRNAFDFGLGGVAPPH
jgi:phospholipase C